MNNSEVLQWFSERAERHKINILNGRVVRSNISPVVGGNALLYRGTLDKKTRVAIKTARFTPKNDRKTLQRILREVHVWSKLRHENIIVLLGVVTDFDFTLSMVIEWMEMGNAHHYVQDRTNDPRPLILGIARGLAYLHSHKPGPVFHGDLKGDNVLISNDGHALITDFGLSALLESSLSIAISEPHGGTYKYMAPEIWEDPAKISAAGDVWAFGMTALELFTRRTPFQGTENAMAVMIRISRGHPNRPNSDSTCHRMTQEWWDLCVSCWNYQVSTRPKISHLVSEIEILMSSPDNNITRRTRLDPFTAAFKKLLTIRRDFNFQPTLREGMKSLRFTKPPSPGALEICSIVFLPPQQGTEWSKPIEITLTLTPVGYDIGYEAVAWQVLNVESNGFFFTAELSRDFGLGVIPRGIFANEPSQEYFVYCPTFNYSPPGWLVEMRCKSESVTLDVLPQPKKSTDIMVRNASGQSRGIAIGCYHAGKCRGDRSRFEPFFVAGDITHGEESSYTSSLVLNAYKTHGVQIGQVMTPEIFSRSDVLFEGKEVKDLNRYTWQVMPVYDGKIKLVEVKEAASTVEWMPSSAT